MADYATPPAAPEAANPLPPPVGAGHRAVPGTADSPGVRRAPRQITAAAPPSIGTIAPVT